MAPAPRAASGPLRSRGRAAGRLRELTPRQTRGHVCTRVGSRGNAGACLVPARAGTIRLSMVGKDKEEEEEEEGEEKEEEEEVEA
eukprot:4284876-Pyramimonas_sp.AAC.1